MPDEQDIFEIADEFRRELLSDDRDAADQLTAAYRDVWGRLSERLQTLTDEIRAMRERGEQPSLAWLLRENRLRSLQQQTEDEIRRLEPRTESRITQQQMGAIGKAEDAARQMVEAQLPESGVFVQWNRLPRSATIDLVGRLQNGSPLRALLDDLGPDASQRIRQALIRSVVTGQGPREIARGMREALGGNLARALTISRTEVLRSYREASRRSYVENDDVVEGWIWHSALNRRTCAFCWAMHGTQHKTSERMATHPNCRCSAIPLTKSWKDLGFGGISESRPTVSDGPDLFGALAASQQLSILGPSKYAAYKRGDIDLDDLVGFRTNRKWGRTGYERPLYEVLERRRRAA